MSSAYIFDKPISDPDKLRQSVFVRDLAQNITSEILALISTDKIPANWDGHELRLLLADRFESSASMSHLRQNRRSRRAKDYRNECAVRGI